MTSSISYNDISYDQATNTYTVGTMAATADINSIISSAPRGATVCFTEGTHNLTSTLYVTRGDITLEGAGRDLTTFSLEFGGQSMTGISVKGKVDGAYASTLADDVKANSHTITVADATGLKAGDVIEIQEANTAGSFNSSGIYNNMVNTSMWGTAPLRQTIAQISSVSGHIVTLDTPVAYDMDHGATTVQRLLMLNNVTLKGFTVTPDLGATAPPDPNLFENVFPGQQSNVAVGVRLTQGVHIENLGIVNAASRGLQIQEALYPHVNDFVANGAYNKGSNGNGYPLHIEESFYGTFTHITTIDTRHGVIFGSNTAEVGNQVQVDYSNRDVNFHGSPDHDNTVIVDKDVYQGPSDKGWPLLADGRPDHAWTDLSANTVLFKYASGGYKDDNVQGWDGGAQLYGNGGNDKLNGGAGNDIISGGAGNDTLTGNAGSDKFLHAYGDGNDVITDFKPGAGGDVINLSGYSGISGFSDMHFVQQGADALLFFGASESYNDSILLKNIKVSSLTPDNVHITDSLPADAGMNITLSKTADYVQTGSGDDVISSYMSYLTPDDVIHTGAGVDSIRFLSQSTFNTALFTKITGVDTLDFNAVTGERIVIDDHFAAQSDNGSLLIKYGAGSLIQLDTSAVGNTHKIYADGSGTVQLADNTGNSIFLSGTNSGKITGGSGNDSIMGGAANDVIDGGTGNDILAGGGGNDSITGGGGSDTFIAARGDNGMVINDFTVDAAAGADRLVVKGFSASELMNAQLVQSGSDASLMLSDGTNVTFHNMNAAQMASANILSEVNGQLTPLVIQPSGGTPVPTLAGTAGNDLLDGIHGKTDNIIMGGGGNDKIIGHDGNDKLYGEDGNDILYGYWGNDIIDGGSGDDILAGGVGNDIATGGNGHDTFIAARGDGGLVINDFTVDVTNGDRLIVKGFSATDLLSVRLTQAGSDAQLQLADGTNVTFHNVNSALLSPANLLAEVNGQLAPLMPVSPGETVTSAIAGTAGNDLLDGIHGKTDNVIMGGGGNDKIIGHDGNDKLYGEDGNDILYGYWGNDTLYGGPGNDILNGGMGDDILNGGSGQDTLSGGSGKDVFVLETLDIRDILTDFNPAEDKLDISAFLGHGGTAHLEMVSGKTGLYIDPDGSGAEHATLAATFDGTSSVSILTNLSDIIT